MKIFACGRILLVRWIVMTSTGPDNRARNTKEMTMTRRLIRYKAKPDRAQENQRLIEGVFQELREKKPDGVRYMVLRMADDSFVHIVEIEGEVNPLQALQSFRTFTGGANERALEPPVANEAVIIGDYRMLEKR
jgi:hypothetical protein